MKFTMKNILGTLFLVFISCFSGNLFAGNWNYDKSKDKMSGKSIEIAMLTSENSLQLGFPYSGVNYGHIMIRKHPQYGLSVIVSVNKGQILCGVYTCHFKIRFNDGAVQDFTMAPSADHSSEAVFAKSPEWAVKHLRNAKSILIQIPMYNEGNQILEFKVDQPLVWPQK